MRPYPQQYVRAIALAGGETVVLRPIRPEDESLMVRFHEGLSDRSVYLRYFHMMALAERTAHERLTRICFIDYDSEIVLLAEGRSAGSGEEDVMGVARLNKVPGTTDGEFAVLIADRFQGTGLGAELMRRLIEIARAEGLSRLRADVLSENAAMRRLCTRLGMAVRPTGDPQLVTAELTLGPLSTV
jgi:acetyltransferase